MKKLEKILLITGFVTGISLFGIGLYKNSKALQIPGAIAVVASSGIALRPSVEYDNYNQQKKFKNYKNKNH